MALERPECLFVDLPEIATLALEPDAEVGDGVEVETDDLPVVAGPQKLPLVLVDVALEG
ncbi:MAG: hypothetical protein ACE5IL_17830 [Myxococcota bacterium]